MSTQNVQLTEDEFEAQYPLIPNHIDKQNGRCWMVGDTGYMFETYGEDLDFVKSVDPRRVWTILESDGQLYIVSGIHYVNRIGYLISQEPVPDGVDVTVQVWVGNSDHDEKVNDESVPY